MSDIPAPAPISLAPYPPMRARWLRHRIGRAETAALCPQSLNSRGDWGCG
jgi:hypothetical protein